MQVERNGIRTTLKLIRDFIHNYRKWNNSREHNGSSILKYGQQIMVSLPSTRGYCFFLSVLGYSSSDSGLISKLDQRIRFRRLFKNLKF